MGKTDDAMSRMAVQAAAGALSLACPCDNIVMCAVLTPSDQLAQVRRLLHVFLAGTRQALYAHYILALYPKIEGHGVTLACLPCCDQRLESFRSAFYKAWTSQRITVAQVWGSGMQDGMGPASVDVQASILVLHDPDAQAIALPSVAPAAASPRVEAKPKRVAARPVLMPNSTWNAMSALAGAERLPPGLLQSHQAERHHSSEQWFICPERPAQGCLQQQYRHRMSLLS